MFEKEIVALATISLVFI